jgi:hypothetical protein
MKWGDRQDFRSYELLRFASLQGYVVVGGMDKLMKAFMHENQPDDIMSYADKDWSEDGVIMFLDSNKWLILK